MPNESQIHPVVIYPFVQPTDLEGLRELSGMLSKLSDDARFAKPVTIINNQTVYRSDPAAPAAIKNPKIASGYTEAIDNIIKPVSEITFTWATDTCALWLRGLGEAFDAAKKNQAVHDIFWLVPGDFRYGTSEGKAALKLLPSIPLEVLNAHCEICLGEIDVPPNSAKQLIDTYGTYGLLYNWFPAEAQGLREVITKPRTEFFAINYATLEQALIPNRWFAYEQTLMILLQNMNGKAQGRKMKRVPLGLITDEESTRSSLAGAMAQVERTERALKLFWRDKAERDDLPNWRSEFRILDGQSESVRSAAMVVLQRLLR